MKINITRINNDKRKFLLNNKTYIYNNKLKLLIIGESDIKINVANLFKIPGKSYKTEVLKFYDGEFVGVMKGKRGIHVPKSIIYDTSVANNYYNCLVSYDYYKEIKVNIKDNRVRLEFVKNGKQSNLIVEGIISQKNYGWKIISRASLKGHCIDMNIAGSEVVNNYLDFMFRSYMTNIRNVPDPSWQVSFENVRFFSFFTYDGRKHVVNLRIIEEMRSFVKLKNPKIMPKDFNFIYRYNIKYKTKFNDIESIKKNYLEKVLFSQFSENLKTILKHFLLDLDFFNQVEDNIRNLVFLNPIKNNYGLENYFRLLARSTDSNEEVKERLCNYKKNMLFIIENYPEIFDANNQKILSKFIKYKLNCMGQEDVFSGEIEIVLNYLIRNNYDYLEIKKISSGQMQNFIYKIHCRAIEESDKKYASKNNRILEKLKIGAIDDIKIVLDDELIVFNYICDFVFLKVVGIRLGHCYVDNAWFENYVSINTKRRLYYCLLGADEVVVCLQGDDKIQLVEVNGNQKNSKSNNKGIEKFLNFWNNDLVIKKVKREIN